MNNPFIPLKEADTVIVAGNASEEIFYNLEKRNLRLIKTIPHTGVDISIRYHPDIVLHPINHNTLVAEPSMFEYYREQFKNTNIKIIKGEKELSCKYPLDIAYNVGRVSGFAIHNFKYTDEVLKYNLKKEGLELINVNQGYTKCSVAIVGTSEIITSDKYIYKKLKEKNIDALLIEAGYIYLENQKYGFIGGCTGNISNREVMISGNIEDHPDREKIKKFLFNINKRINFLSEEKINDIGSIISLNCN